MKQAKNIFDLEDTKDLPHSMQKIIKLNGLNNDTLALLALFDIKPVLTLSEIIVGLYRNNKLEKTRNWVASTTYNLTRKGLLKKIATGTYQKEKQL